MSNKLTPAQQKALPKLTGEWQCAYSIGVSMATLSALCSKGFAEHKQDALGAMFSPTTANHYRLKGVSNQMV